VDNPNLETLRVGYEALVAGNLDTVAGLLAEGIKAHVPERSPVAGDSRHLGGGRLKEIWIYPGDLHAWDAWSD
jgi:hypothetical protein